MGTDPNAIGMVYIQGFGVNIRKNPSTNDKVVTQVDKPASFLISQKQDGWLKLDDYPGPGWIKYDKSYIIFLENKPGIYPNSYGVATIQGIGVNIRKGPAMPYDVVKQVNQTDAITQYQVFEIKNGWLNLGANQWLYYDPSYIAYQKS